MWYVSVAKSIFNNKFRANFNDKIIRYSVILSNDEILPWIFTPNKIHYSYIRRSRHLVEMCPIDFEHLYVMYNTSNVEYNFLIRKKRKKWIVRIFLHLWFINLNHHWSNLFIIQLYNLSWRLLLLIKLIKSI